MPSWKRCSRHETISIAAYPSSTVVRKATRMSNKVPDFTPHIPRENDPICNSRMYGTRDSLACNQRALTCHVGAWLCAGESVERYASGLQRLELAWNFTGLSRPDRYCINLIVGTRARSSLQTQYAKFLKLCRQETLSLDSFSALNFKLLLQISQIDFCFFSDILSGKMLKNNQPL